MANESISHARIAGDFTVVVERVTNWDVPTPVAEWRAHNIVEHLLAWPPPLLLSWCGVELGDDTTNTLPSRWRRRVADLQAILEDPDQALAGVKEGPFAGRSTSQLIDRIYTPDVFMHCWDLARATGQDAALDPELAGQIHEGLCGMDEVLRSSGQYGPAHPTSSADPVDQLMGFIGRDPEWHATATGDDT